MKLRVKIDDQAFDVEVGDLTQRPIIALVNGEAIEVWPEEALAAKTLSPTTPSNQPATASPPVQSAIARPSPAAVGDRSKQAIAPIPGTIVSIAVKEGDMVQPSQELLSLEAMKMKNIIRATRPGTIARILVKTGDKVTQGQALVEFAD